MKAEAKAAGSAKHLLAQPAFLRLWLLGGLANTTRWLEMLSAGLFTFEVTGSGAAVATVTAARMLPMLLFGALAGALSEALNRKHILVAGLIVTTVTSATVAVLAVTGRIELWHIAVAGFLSGAVWAGEMATRRRMIGEAAGPDRIVQGIAVDSVSNSSTRMFGPLLGGILFDTIGLGGAYACSFAAQLVSLALVSGLVYEQETRRLQLARIPADIMAGLRLAQMRPTILMVFAVTIVVNAFGFSYSALVAPVGQGHFGVSPTLVGVLAAAEPLGAIVGAILLASGLVRLSRAIVFIGGSVTFFLALAVMSLSPSYVLAVVALVAGGLGTAGFGNMQSSLILTEAPQEMRSRLMGIVTVCIGTGPLGVLAAGAISAFVGPANAVLVMASVGLLAITLISMTIARRRS